MHAKCSLRRACLITLAAAFAMFGLSVIRPAQANIINLGVISPLPDVEFVTHTPPTEPTPFSFSDFFYFTVPGGITVSNAVNDPLTIFVFGISFSVFDIQNLRMSLYNAANNQLIVGPIAGSYSTPLSGDFYWNVEGTTTGSGGGAYTFLISTAIPEPFTLLLFATGLAMFGAGRRPHGVSWRRNDSRISAFRMSQTSEIASPANCLKV